MQWAGQTCYGAVHGTAPLQLSPNADAGGHETILLVEEESTILKIVELASHSCMRKLAKRHKIFAGIESAPAWLKRINAAMF